MATTDTRTLKQPNGSMVEDLKQEVKHEVHNMHYVKEPVDPTHSDRVVRRHVAGISISFFVAILVFLAAVMAGVYLYQRSHSAPQTPTHQNTALHIEPRNLAA